MKDERMSSQYDEMTGCRQYDLDVRSMDLQRNSKLGNFNKYLQ
jgi:hypothetical protein